MAPLMIDPLLAQPATDRLTSSFPRYEGKPTSRNTPLSAWIITA